MQCVYFWEEYFFFSFYSFMHWWLKSNIGDSLRPTDEMPVLEAVYLCNS